jgi:hypothetical protein
MNDTGAAVAALGDGEPTRADNLTWPAPLKAALSGLVGEFVERVLPTTEADGAALVFQFLVAFGNVIGRTAHWVVEDTPHYCNLFTCLVGDTAHGRKGTSGNRVMAAFRGIDEEWDERVKSGLSTGEGLIALVRDPIRDQVPIREKGKELRYEEQVIDAGVVDKRALIVEGEFARVLQAGDRPGNTLSAIIRDVWDGKALGALTKARAATCKEPHISLIGHITRDELRRLMTDASLANGFGNRFLYVAVRRSKMLPHGGDRVDLGPLRVELSDAIHHARRLGAIEFDSAAREHWASAYETLTSPRRGMFGFVTARAEAQTRRLACIYALLDREVFIRLKHLEAALDCWRYAEDSARVVFGNATGDPTVDAIKTALASNPEGMTRTELIHLFGRHKSAAEIGRALDSMQSTGAAAHRILQTAGRPSERWFLIS